MNLLAEAHVDAQPNKSSLLASMFIASLTFVAIGVQAQEFITALKFLTSILFVAVAEVPSALLRNPKSLFKRFSALALCLTGI